LVELLVGTVVGLFVGEFVNRTGALVGRTGALVDSYNWSHPPVGSSVPISPPHSPFANSS